MSNESRNLLFKQAVASGERITAKFVNQLIEMVLGRIVVGKGLQRRQLGQSLILEAAGAAGTGATGTVECPMVRRLPAITDAERAAPRLRFVYWATAEELPATETLPAANGDGQVWAIYTTQDAWRAVQDYTVLSGTPE